MVMKPGDRYGEFEILGHLGSGGFGHVYEVRAPGYDTPMALKLSQAPVTDPAVAQRALREVAILRRLTNPHVVRVYDSGLRRDGHIYLLMERLEGKPLYAWHDFDTALAPAWACHIVHQCCEGLTEAHARGVVHRDLKPGNIFVQDQVVVRLLDFGLARSWDDGSIAGNNATRSGMLVGTPHYAQPEQLDGNELSPAADVYSLGMLLYELLTGHTPFVADRPVTEVAADWNKRPMAWMRAHSRQAVVPLSQHTGGGERLEALEDLVMRMLAKDPRARPRDATELARQLLATWPRQVG